jgi:hypothetical protein
MPLTAPGAGVLLFVTGGFCVTRSEPCSAAPSAPRWAPARAMAIMTAGIPLAALVLFFSPIRRTRDLPASYRPPAGGSARPESHAARGSR